MGIPRLVRAGAVLDQDTSHRTIHTQETSIERRSGAPGGKRILALPVITMQNVVVFEIVRSGTSAMSGIRSGHSTEI